MINFTKLLGGKPTVSAALEAVSKKRENPLFASCNASSPLVVFNLTRSCNLECRHCYLESKNVVYENELSTLQIKKVIDSLAEIDIPVLLFSGGEPLVHKDILPLIEYAKSKKIRVGLSTNGTLISKTMAKNLARSGIDYVGVSIDGRKSLHDEFRKIKGSYDLAMKGIINAQEAGLKTGLRFTISKANVSELPAVLDLCIKEKIPRFCMYHLVYSGRGKNIADIDIDNKTRRKVVDFLVQRALEYNKKKIDFEMLTVDNHADGIYIYNYLKKINPQAAEEVLKLLEFHGGCSAGSKVVDISPAGDVFACQFWQQEALGNVRDTEFSQIWLDKNNKRLCQLRFKSNHLLGKCGQCSYKSYCGGCRIRALVVHDDLWAEDPCCYLTEDEIR